MDFIKKKKNRELVLTTLIDLLVQILFIFTIVLIINVSTEAGKNEASNEDFPEIWNTLVKALGLDKDDKTHKERAEKIVKNMKELEEKNNQLERKLGGGAPGKPLCLNSDKKAIDFILEVKIIDNSIIFVQPTVTASNMMTSNKLPRIEGFGNISLQDFDKKFNPWFKHGDTQIGGGCRYRAIIIYSDNISAAVLDKTYKTVGKLFYQAIRGE
jgi:hypothetical protein